MSFGQITRTAMALGEIKQGVEVGFGEDTTESEWEGTLLPMKDTIILKTNWEKEAEARKYHHQHGSKATSEKCYCRLELQW